MSLICHIQLYNGPCRYETGQLDGVKVSKRKIKVLVVDDDPAIREMIRFVLGKSGMKVRRAASGREALEKIGEKPPDILLLDWMMPNLSGTELTRYLRKNPLTKDIPIIMLTAKVTEDDKVTGLNAGADDYITKPFSPRELVARIEAVLRRTEPSDEDGKITVGLIVMDTLSRQVVLDGQPTHLGPTEYRLLEFFMTHENRVYSRSQLLDHVWGPNVFLEERTVDVHIKRLRKVLKQAKLHKYIQTVRSHGYIFTTRETQ
ncbi:MAG: phosphate regulon transcriptional regulatory protein PhoB [Gammaproteobacteria bacterium]|nr:phosphate regulon transcriptional regulatory protein PhoB [Gammaproteobacteria bacterium]